MKAITTKYIPPTNTKPARIKAMAEGVPAITYSYGKLEGMLPGTNTDDTHKKAAELYIAANGWSGELIGGGLPDQSGYCFVFAPPENLIIRNLESQVKVQDKIIKSLENESAELVAAMENVLNEFVHVPGDIEGNKARTTAARIIGSPRAALARAREAIEKAKANK